jgi:hypothetical protein
MKQLEEAWRRQLAFTSLLFETLVKPLDQLTDDDRVQETKDYVEYMHAELVEILNNVPWKKHRYLGAAKRDDLLEEMIDTQKFLWGLMMVWGVTPLEFLRAFERKSDVVDQRFRQEHLLPRQVLSDKVAIVDIDDVVADWEHGFEKWVKAEEPELKPEDYAKHTDPGLRQSLKDRIHSSGGMLKLPPLKHSHVALNTLVQAGYTVVWLTARPVSKHPRLMGDTVQWLQDYDFPTDYIYYSDLNKHLFIGQKFPMAAVLFDDKPTTIQHAKEFGLQAYTVKDGDFLDCVRRFLHDTA